MTHLNDISKVYMEKVAKPDFLDLDKDRNKKEPMKKAAVEAPKERLKTDRDGYRVPKKDADAARERLLAKARAKRAKMSEALDPVGKEDSDPDNDGKKNTKADKYLMNRRKAIGKAMKEECIDEDSRRTSNKQHTQRVRSNIKSFGSNYTPPDNYDPDANRGKGEVLTRKQIEKKRRKAIAKAIKEAKHATAKQMHSPHEVPSGNLKGLVKKAVKRIDTDVDGDTDKNDKAKGELGEFIPGVGNKRLYSTTKTTTAKESFSNWRDELREVMGENGEEQKQVKEKNVKNTIKINPKISEEVTILESTEMDEVDLDIYIVYDELVQEGYDVYDIEDAIEYALVEVSDRYYDSAVKASKQAAAKKNREELKKKAVGRLRYMKRKAGEAVSSAKKKVGMASAKAQVAAYNKGREVVQTAGDKVRRAKKAVSDAPQKAKSGIKSKIKKVAQKVVDRMSEENNMQMTPQEVALQKRKTMIDLAISQKRRQALSKVNKEEFSLEEGRAEDAQASLAKVKARQKVLDAHEKKTGKKLDISKTPEHKAHKQNFPGAKRTGKKVPGAKETPDETHRRRVNKTVDRIVKKGYTSKEKKEVQSMAKHASRFD